MTGVDGRARSGNGRSVFFQVYPNDRRKEILSGLWGESLVVDVELKTVCKLLPSTLIPIILRRRA